MARALLFLLLVPFLVSAQDTVDVWTALDKGDLESLKKLSADELLATLKKGRTYEKVEAFENKRDLTDAFDRKTDLYLIVPEEPTGVIFVLHGLGGNGTQLKDRLYTEFAKKHGLIIAAPSAKKEPKGNLNEDSNPLISGNMPHWWLYKDGNFVFSALSELKKEFPIDENRVYLSGYSMGGFGTWGIGSRYPDRFAALVPFAGGVSRAEYMNRKGDKKARKLLFNLFQTPVYFVHGDRDQTVPVKFDRMNRDDLKKLDYEFEYVEVPKGRHILDVSEGGELMNPIQEWLKDKKRNAHPKTVKHASLGEYMNQSYWLRIDEFSDKSAKITAEIKEGNVIEVTSEGAKSLTLFLDEAHIDLSRPVIVKVNGENAFEGEVKPGVDVVLESWKAREDRDLLYRAKVVVNVP